MSQSTVTLGTLAAELGATLRGDPDVAVTGLATLGSAGPTQLSFLANPLYRSQLETTRAAAVLVHPDVVASCPVNALVCDNPYLKYAQVSHRFDDRCATPTGVHASAVVAADVQMGAGCRIGPNVVIESGSVLGAGVEVGPGSVIGANCTLGAGCVLRANVTLYHNVKLGQRCQLHSGVVLGSDGFGFANEKGHWRKIAQLGGVTLGDDVDVGANTTIDRGALDDTRIGRGVILDNQIQIAHNVEIGEFTAIAGCTGIAGSTRIGSYCTIAGAVGIAGHLQITDRVHITMRSAVTGHITEPGSYSSGTALTDTRSWRRNAARFRRLDDLFKRFGALERILKSQR